VALNHFSYALVLFADLFQFPDQASGEDYGVTAPAVVNGRGDGRAALAVGLDYPADD
jgi:hypothetical protein